MSEPEPTYDNFRSVDEAFGQAGIRQFLVPVIITGCCCLIAILSLLWWRSDSTADQLRYSSDGSTLSAVSVMGRLTIDSRTDAAGGSRVSRWNYRTLPYRTIQDGWQSSVWKLIGIEWADRPLDPSSTAGAWLRVKYYFLIALSAAYPLFVMFRKLHARDG